MKYKEELESYGALVKLVETGDMDCVLKSQIIRVLAFLLPEVRKSLLSLMKSEIICSPCFVILSKCYQIFEFV